MKVCPKCGAPISDDTSFFCTQCGAKLLLKNTLGAEPAVSGPEPVGQPPISPAPVNPTPIQATPVQATPIEATPIEPTVIKPTIIEPTSIEPTNIQPTVIKPSEINPTPIKPFQFKMLWMNALIAIIALIALLITLSIGRSSLLSWIFALIFAAGGVFGVIGLLKEILKLPINQAVIDRFNGKLKPGQTPVSQGHLNPIQNIRFRIASAAMPTQAISLGAIGVAALLTIISLSTVLIGTGNPVGTWRQDVSVSQHATERHCLYVFNRDNTLDYLDHREYDYQEMPVAEDSGGGTWTQNGNHITTTITWMLYYEHTTETTLTDPDTAYWTISGDKMTSGGVVIYRVKD